MKSVLSVLRTTVIPLVLMLVCPPAVIVLWMICARFDGSVVEFYRQIDLPTFIALCPRPTLLALRILLIFAAFEAALLVLLPGKTHYGPITPAGNRPRYKLNGVSAYLITHAVLIGAALGLKLFSPAIVYDNLGSILVVLNLLGLGLSAVLYAKGVYFPSSSDSKRTGNVIFDCFQGVELHPSVRGYSLKQYVNCRLAMMGWSLIVLSCVAREYESRGGVSNATLVSATLQIVYIMKFFWWESGYFGSLDIMHDRFGFYIFWGVMAWLPCLYTLVSQYLAIHSVDLPEGYAWLCLGLGLAAIWANYDADAQRQRVRETDGQALIWGKKPELISARYVTADGEERTNLLLVSGWWGVSRHFHYVAELTLALAWTVPAGFGRILPYFYFIFLTILLVDRAGRDEKRCRAKYGADWALYCNRVPYRIVPYLY